MLLIVTSIIVLFEICVVLHKSLVSFVCHLLIGMNEEYNHSCLELKRLEMEQKSISMQNEFAKYSKLQRRINTFSSKICEIKKSRSLFLTQISYTLKSIIYAIYMVLMFCIFYFYNSESIVVLPKTWFPYLRYVLAIPTGKEGAIGFPVWVLICRQFMKSLME